MGPAVQGFYIPDGIDWKKPWNDPANERHFRAVVPLFLNPNLRGAAFRDPQGYGLSHYAANSHVIGPNRIVKTGEMTDGAANTLLIGEANAAFQPWGHPVGWRDPALGINASPRGFGGAAGKGGAQFLMADGSIRFVRDSVRPEVLKAMATPAGGDTVPREGWAD